MLAAHIPSSTFWLSELFAIRRPIFIALDISSLRSSLTVFSSQTIDLIDHSNPVPSLEIPSL